MDHEFQRIPWKFFENVEMWMGQNGDRAEQCEDQIVGVDVWPGSQ